MSCALLFTALVTALKFALTSSALAGSPATKVFGIVNVSAEAMLAKVISAPRAARSILFRIGRAPQDQLLLFHCPESQISI
jgi:hypothetical protein